MASGVVDYFPDALIAVAEVSYVGNEQHNPGKPLFWDRSKSTDEADALMRHFVQRGTRDSDGMRHSAKVAWRALALLQKELESELEVDAAFALPPAYELQVGDHVRLKAGAPFFEAETQHLVGRELQVLDIVDRQGDGSFSGLMVKLVEEAFLMGIDHAIGELWWRASDVEVVK